jgi:hypothetical protein
MVYGVVGYQASRFTSEGLSRGGRSCSLRNALGYQVAVKGGDSPPELESVQSSAVSLLVIIEVNVIMIPGFASIS